MTCRHVGKSQKMISAEEKVIPIRRVTLPGTGHMSALITVKQREKQTGGGKKHPQRNHGPVRLRLKRLPYFSAELDKNSWILRK